MIKIVIAYTVFVMSVINNPIQNIQIRSQTIVKKVHYRPDKLRKNISKVKLSIKKIVKYQMETRI